MLVSRSALLVASELASLARTGSMGKKFGSFFLPSTLLDATQLVARDALLTT